MMDNRVDPVRSFLESVRTARFIQRQCELKLEQLDAACTSTTARLSGMPGGGSGDVHKDGPLVALAQTEEDLRQAYQDAKRKEREVEKFIEQLADVRHRAVLTMYYVNLMKWPRVVDELEKCGMYYSERHVFRLHGEALQAARILWSELHPEEGEEHENRNRKTENFKEVANCGDYLGAICRQTETAPAYGRDNP